MSEELSEDLIHFINTIPSIPYLEAMLLLQGQPTVSWKNDTIASRLYLSPEQARVIILKLCKANICKYIKSENAYRFSPKDQDLAALISQLTFYYSKNLVLITNLIHANSSKHAKAQEFADTFLWRKK